MHRRPTVVTQRLADLRDQFWGGKRQRLKIAAAIRRAEAALRARRAA